MVGLILGLILGIAYAFLREFVDDTIRDEEDINRGTSVGIVGAIPSIKREKKGILKVFESPKSRVTEAFRSIRTNLQFIAPGATSQVIVVTSTVAGEGKTTIAANLGGVISMTGKRVIVLNLDMRKPALHERFDLPNLKGMSTVLSYHGSLSEVIQQTKYENLHIISSGPVPPNPSELIQNERMEEVINMLRGEYDVIILDTPPVGLVVDAYTLMHLADATMYVVRANYAKRGFLKNVEKIYRTEGIKGVGIILNDMDMSRDSYGYGYGGYYEENS
jgi:capsular exopolysaccharide synthesis family protein